MKSIGLTRLRGTVFLVSLVTVVLEITLMRELSLRFWEHLAWMVISIALLGFGVSGTILVLLTRFSRSTDSSLGGIALLGLGVSIPASLRLGDAVDLNLVQMAWQPVLAWKIGLLELVFALPFIFSGIYIGLALKDDPERVPGHYGAGFIGSGLGGVLVLPALFLFSPRLILLACAVLIFAAGLAVFRDKIKTTGSLCAFLALTVLVWQFPGSVTISDDKDLPQLMALPGSEIVARRYSPEGLLQIVRAPSFHGAPGLALTHSEPLPDQLLVLLDGHITGRLYRNTGVDSFGFLDNTTTALAYRLLGSPSRVLLGPEAGAVQTSLAVYHGAEEVTSLVDNSSLAGFKTVEAAAFIDHLYRRPDVSLVIATLRRFLHDSDTQFSLIELPVTGEDLGGLRSATANPLLTMDTFRSCYRHLEDTGVLSITTQAHIPPRESLRLLNMFVGLLEGNGRNPRTHIAMIRSWATVTLVATRSEITAEQAATIRYFCQSRGFDLVWLPDLKSSEVNRYHILDEPYYYLGAKNLLGGQSDRFVSHYVFNLQRPDDGKPFFHHFGRGFSKDLFSDQLGRRSRVYTEIGKTLLIAALEQAFILAFTLIVLPMLPVIGIPGRLPRQMLVIGFFASVGCGFMLLEMSFLQRLVIYLGHPVYAASAVLSGFLFFGGLGSFISSVLKGPLKRPHCLAGLAVAVLAIVYQKQLDPFLSLSEGLVLAARFAIVVAVTGPPALLMGMMFPLGMKRLGYEQAKMIPWAWSVNGFTSVLATLLAPLIAMYWGFGAVCWSAAACYCLAALFSLGLPAR